MDKKKIKIVDTTKDNEAFLFMYGNSNKRSSGKNDFKKKHDHDNE